MHAHGHPLDRATKRSVGACAHATAWRAVLCVASWSCALLLGAGCFSPKQPAVMFSCEPQARDDCPDGYRCLADGCCHREDTDPTANLGDCKLTLDTTDGSATTTATDSTDGTQDVDGGTDTDAGSTGATDSEGDGATTSTDAG